MATKLTCGKGVSISCSAVEWALALALALATVTGCVDGADDSSSAAACTSRTLAPDAESRFGFTGLELSSAVSGQYTGSLIEGDERFWVLLDEEPATPLDVLLSIQDFASAVVESSCATGLQLELTLDLQLAGETIASSASAVLTGSPETAETEWAEPDVNDALRPVRLRFRHAPAGDRVYLTVGDGLGAANLVRQ